MRTSGLWSARGALALLILLSTVAAAPAEDDLAVTVAAPWMDGHGYTPLIVTIAARIEADVTLEAECGTMRARLATHVVPGGPARRTLLLPVQGSDYLPGGEVVWSDGHGHAGTAAFGAGGAHGQSDLALAVIDPGEELHLPALADALEKLGVRSSRSVQRIAPDLLPERWQGYPFWLTLCLTPGGEAALAGAQRAALAQWTQAGGAVFVTTPAQVARWAKDGVAATCVDSADAAQVRALQQRIATAGEGGGLLDRQAVPGTENVPVAGFFTLAIGFALLAGPLNLWWAQRRNARHLLLLSTPVLSAATCLVLLVVSLFHDGLGVRRSTIQATCLDVRRGRAVTWTACTYFAAFARSSAVLDQDARLERIDQEGSSERYGRQALPLSADWRAGQLLTGDLVPARRNRTLIWVEPRPDRRRIAISRSGDGWSVGNGLGATITALVWLDADLQPWRADGIADGQRAALKRIPRDPAGGGWHQYPPTALAPGAGLRQGFLGHGHRQVALPLGEAPGAFVAQLDRPFATVPGPDGAEAQPVQSTVFGTCAGDPAAAPGGR